MAKEMNWWLKKDCRECDAYCDFIEANSPKPRGCSLWHKSNPKETQGLKKGEWVIEEVMELNV